MHHPDDSLPDPEIDQMLKTWRQALGSDDSQLQRMRARVESRLVSMASGGPNLVRSARPASASIRPGRSVVAVMAVLLVLGLTGWLLELPRPEVTLSEQSPAAPVAFTAAEIRKREELVCELDRVFEHHMLGVYQNGQAVEVDLAEQSLATVEAPRLVMRFVLQQRVGNGEWSTANQEEVIGQADHQFDLRADSHIVVGYWSHLLPDDSLWLETTITLSDGAVVSHSGQYQNNHPTEVWSQSFGAQQRRILVVYDLLNPCRREVI